MMDLHLVSDAKDWHRWWSVRAAVAGAAFTVGSAVFPTLLGYVSPAEHPVVFSSIAGSFFFLTLISRLVDQPSLDN